MASVAESRVAYRALRSPERARLAKVECGRILGLDGRRNFEQ